MKAFICNPKEWRKPPPKDMPWLDFSTCQCEGRSKHRENLVYVDVPSPECKAES
jgi:hypothetical protein